MDYFNYFFTTFLGLESGNSVSVYGGVRKLSDFIKKYLHLCSEEGLLAFNKLHDETNISMVSYIVSYFGFALALRSHKVIKLHLEVGAQPYQDIFACAACT